MANIQPVGVNDPQAINKVNAAIVEANKVDTLQSAISAEVADRQQAINSESSLRMQAIQQEATARQAGDKAATDALSAGLRLERTSRESQVKQLQSDVSLALKSETAARIRGISAETEARERSIESEASSRGSADDVRPKFSDAVDSSSRPGEAPEYFCKGYDGHANILDPYKRSDTVESRNGRVLRLTGASVVSTSTAFRMEPGRQYRIRCVVQRSRNTDDPANDGVVIGVCWLNSGKARIDTYDLATIVDLQVKHGRQEYQFNVAANDGDKLDAVGPSGVIYFRPFVQTYGVGVTFVEVIEVTDLSTSSEWSPDVTDLQRAVARLLHQLENATDRIEALEARV